MRLSGLGLGGVLVWPTAGHTLQAPGTGVIEGALTRIPRADKKSLADRALETATSNGATYADVRIGRYLNQSIQTREDRVQNIANTESYGAGIRVIADGTWGFAATSDVTPEGIAQAAKSAVAIARANARIQDEPVILAPVEAYGEVSWQTPIETNAFEIPLSEKVELLLAANAAAMDQGTAFASTDVFFVNEQNTLHPPRARTSSKTSIAAGPGLPLRRWTARRGASSPAMH